VRYLWRTDCGTILLSKAPGREAREYEEENWGKKAFEGSA